MNSEEHTVENGPTHRPSSDGLFASTALCGAVAGNGILRMHEWEYDCPACARLSGEVTP